MAKKPLAVPAALLLTLTMLGSISIATPVHATSVLENGLQYWTIQDIIEYGREAEAERTTLCGNDTSCKEQYYYEHMDGGEDRTRYQLLDRFNSTRIWLTSINPTTGEAKFLYQGTDGWAVAMGYNVGPENLNELYFAWLQGDAIDKYYSNSWFDPTRNHYVPDYVDEILSGELPPDTHEIFSYNIERDGYIAYPERTEIDFTISSTANLGANTDGAVYYSNMVGGLRTHGVYNYSSCISNPYYREGMECRFVFTEDYMEQFVPFTEDGVLATAENGVEHNNNNNDNTDDMGDANDDNNATSDDNNTDILEYTENNPAPSDGNEANGVDETTEPTGTTDNTETNINTYSTSKIISTPNTGQLTTEESSNTPEFPWWLIAIIFIGDIAILWHFSPRRRKNRK